MPPTGTFAASVEITINGDTIRRVNHIRIGQRFDSHHDFEISVSPDMLPDRTIKLRELAEKFVGKNAAITLRQGRTGLTEQTQLFSGIVTSVRLVKGQSQSSTYLISGLSPTILMAAGRNTRSFTNKTLGDIANQVLTPFPFTGIISPSHTATIPYVTQYEEDNFHFLQRLAETFGEWMYYDGRNFIFGKGARQSSPTVQLTQGSNLFDMEYGLRVTPLNFKASYFDYEAFELFKADSAGEQVEGLSSFPQMTHDRSNELFTDELVGIDFTNHPTESSLKKAVKFKKSEQSNKLAVFTGRSPEMEMKIGGLLSISEPVFLNGIRTDTINYGTFVVTRLNHFLDARGVYQANFEAIPQDSDFPPVDYRIVPPLAKPHIAQVRDTNDPLQLGRVKVQFGWQPDGESTPFIRVSSMMTGRSKSYFIPEVSDMVMVDFELGNPDLPYVAASMYANDNGARKPGNELFQPENKFKGIITKGGNHILIDDTEGHEKIRIFNKENKNEIELSLDGDSHINIKSKGSVNISAGSINLNASKININASDELKLHGEKGVKGTSKETIDIQAKSYKLKSDADVDIEGMNVNIKATANAKVEAGAQLDLKGGPMAILKAGIVQIN